MKVKVDGGQVIEIPDTECKTDERLRAALTPYYNNIAQAEIRRDRTKGVIWVDTKIEEAVDDFLHGRQLLVAFSWMPGVKGKVGVTVNATNLVAEASRKLISADLVPKMPEDVVLMISEVLEKAEKAAKPKGKAKAAGGKR